MNSWGEKKQEVADFLGFEDFGHHTVKLYLQQVEDTSLRLASPTETDEPRKRRENPQWFKTTEVDGETKPRPQPALVLRFSKAASLRSIS